MVGEDTWGWHERFVPSLEAARLRDPRLSLESVSLDGDDWIDRVRAADVVIWNPVRMGPIAASQYKEKIYHLERIMGKRVVPNYASVWHFESKVAQSYLLRAFGVPQPRTLVSFEWNDALRGAIQLGLPVVAKASHGAGSSNVRLLRKGAQVRRHVEWRLSHERWHEAKILTGSRAGALRASIMNRWFWYAVARRVMGRELTEAVYLQSFVPANQRDLRVTVIGRTAYAFWRRNRPGDFRASGSHLLDYDSPVPEGVIRRCIEWSSQMGFDSMAYDIVFAENGAPLILEISYNYVASALASAPCRWTLDDGGELQRHDGAIWPQELWIEHALRTCPHAESVGV